jgi:hypothetical protein
VTASTRITLNGQAATLAALQTGESARAVYDPTTGNALVLGAHTPMTKVHGTVTAVSGTTVPATVTVTPATGTAVTVNVTTTTKVFRNGQAATLAALQIGDLATAVYDATTNNASVLAAHVKLTRVHGTITAVGGTIAPAAVTIAPATGSAVTVTVTTSTRIVRNGRAATLADLQVNDLATAAYDPSNNAVALVAHVREYRVEGTIAAVSGTTVPATVTVTPRNASAPAVTVTVTASTVIRRLGQAATLADLQVNDRVRVTYDAGNNALSLVDHGP